jgi:threonine dehydrogenase-like Zn-dependent dehydrogenase
MKATVYHGLKSLSVDEVPDPVIENPTDVIVKVTKGLFVVLIYIFIGATFL